MARRRLRRQRLGGRIRAYSRRDAANRRRGGPEARDASRCMDRSLEVPYRTRSMGRRGMRRFRPRTGGMERMRKRRRRGTPPHRLHVPGVSRRTFARVRRSGRPTRAQGAGAGDLRMGTAAGDAHRRTRLASARPFAVRSRGLLQMRSARPSRCRLRGRRRGHRRNSRRKSGCRGR